MFYGVGEEERIIDWYRRMKFAIGTRSFYKHQLFVGAKSFVAMSEDGVIEGLCNISGVEIKYFLQVHFFDFLPNMSVFSEGAQKGKDLFGGFAYGLPIEEVAFFGIVLHAMPIADFKPDFSAFGDALKHVVIVDIGIQNQVRRFVWF